MGEYSPSAIIGVYNQIHAKIPSAVLSGVLGDASHTYGYHRGRAVLGSGDYSVQSALDRQGDAWAASALDVSFPPADMKAVTGRLIAAMRAQDTRTKCLREIFGTVNGYVVTGWDHGYNNAVASDDSWTSSDDTHLWHVHFSIYRTYVNNASALAGIAAVCAGVGGSTPTPKPVVFKPTSTNYPLGAGIYFGLASDPDNYRSGDPRYDPPVIRSYVLAIQNRLNALGYRAGFADGVYETPTLQAVQRFQKRAGITTNGRVGSTVWKRLFSSTAPKAATTTAVRPASSIPAWHLPAGHYYGPITGGPICHGGYYASEKPDIVLIQKRLQFLKFAPSTAGWADGIYEAETVSAMKKLQANRHIPQSGLVGYGDWRVLFS